MTSACWPNGNLCNDWKSLLLLTRARWAWIGIAGWAWLGVLLSSSGYRKAPLKQQQARQVLEAPDLTLNRCL